MLTLSNVSPAETSLTVAHKRDTANKSARKDRINHIMRSDSHKDPSSATHIELNVRASRNRSAQICRSIGTANIVTCPFKEDIHFACPRSGSAIAAAHDSWVEFQPPLANELAAAVAPPEFFSVYPFYRGLDRADAAVTPTVLCSGHCLLLHRIHSAEAPDALLVKFDWSAVVHRCRGSLMQILKFLPQPRKELGFQLFRCRICHSSIASERQAPCKSGSSRSWSSR